MDSVSLNNMNSVSLKMNTSIKCARKDIINIRVVVFLLLLGSITSYSKIIILNFFFNAVIILYGLLLLCLCFKTTFSKFELSIVAIFFLMALLRIISMFYSEVMYSFNSIIQLVIICVTLCAGSRLQISKRDVNFINILFLIVCGLGVIDYFASKDKISFTIFGSMNTLAGVFLFLFILGLVFAQYYFKHWHLINFFLCLLLIGLSTSRTPLLSLAVLLFSLLLIKKLAKSVNWCKGFIFFVIIFLFLLIVLYMYVDEWTHFDYINELSQKYFKKNIDSGRPNIWRDIVKRLDGHWLFGLGYAEQGFDYSAHNQFIQLLGDIGISGLLLFLVLYVLIWNKLAKYAQDKVVRVTMALMVVFLVYNCFEVALLQNKFALACIEWLCIAIGLNKAKYLKENLTHWSTYCHETKNGC